MASAPTGTGGGGKMAWAAVGPVATAATQYAGGKADRKQRERARQQAMTRAAAYDTEYGAYQDELRGMFAPGTALYSQLMGPQETTSTTRTSRSGSSDTTPTISEQFAPDVSSVQSILRERLRGPGVPAGYEASQIRNINRGAEGARQRVANAAASQGLSGQQVAGMSMPIETNTANEIADFQAGLPLMARKMQGEDLSAMSQLAETFGKGEHQDYSELVNSVMKQISPADMQAILAYFREIGKPVEPTYFPS